eukprot:symbB.v1.2.029559.t1/scaffold3251.1/size60191/1
MQPQALLTALPLFVIVRYSLFENKQLSTKDLAASETFTPQVNAPFDSPESQEVDIEGLVEGHLENATICKMVGLNESTSKSISECNFSWH